MEAVSKIILEAGAVGVLGFLSVWMALRTWPATIQAFREELAAEREQCQEQHKEIMDELKEIKLVLRQILD